MSVLTITKENFEQEVLNSDKPVLLDFWASWCVPCKMAAPIVEQVANEAVETVKVGKVNVNDEPELAQAFQVSSIPAFMIVKNGQVTNSTVGVQSKENLLSLIS